MMSEEGNLTGGQIQEIMDNLLYSALEPVVRFTNLFDTQLSYLLTIITTNKKRKVCAIDREQSLAIICHALCTQDPVEKMDLIRKLAIERSFIHVFLKRFVAKYKQPFFDLYTRYLYDYKNREVYRKRIRPYVHSSGCGSRSELFVVLNTVDSNLQKFYAYFDSIVAQYYKLCYTQAKGLQKANPNNKYDFNDLVQNFRRKIVTALNKYHSGSGALTTYIKWWLYNSITCSSAEHEYGIAYTIPQNHKKKLMEGNSGSVNFSVSLDTHKSGDGEDDVDLHQILSGETPELDEEASSDDMTNRLYLIAKNADPYGIARLSLDIPEVFTQGELKMMARITAATLSKSVNR